MRDGAVMTMKPSALPVISIILTMLVAGCGGPAPSTASSNGPIAFPSESPRSTATAPLVVGQEALISAVPSEADAWRVLLDSVAYGDDAISGLEADQLPALPPENKWLSIHIEGRYVGTGTPHQSLAAPDFILYHALGSQIYETQVVGGWPTLEVDMVKDEDRGLTFLFAIPGGDSTLILTWTAFGQPVGSYQWNLPPWSVSASPSEAPDAHALWGPPTSGGLWKTFEGQANWVLGTDYPNLRPPALLVAKVTKLGKVSDCTLFLRFEGDAGGESSEIFTQERAPVRLIRVMPGPFGSTSWTFNVTSTSCPWTVDLSTLGTKFGPNSLAVADFILRSNELASDWAHLVIVSTSASIQARAEVSRLSAIDPNLANALTAALSSDWYKGNQYLENDLATREARADAIAAIVLEHDVPEGYVEALYRPLEDLIPFLSLQR